MAHAFIFFQLASFYTFSSSSFSLLTTTPVRNRISTSRFAAINLTNQPHLPLLVHFRDVHPSFRIAEFRAVASALCRGTTITFSSVESDGEKADFFSEELAGMEEPPVFLFVQGLTAEEAGTVADRCVCLRAIYEVSPSTFFLGLLSIPILNTSSPS